MTRPEELRRYLYTAGFSIQEEEIVRDGHRLYTVIAAAYTGECLEPRARTPAHRPGLPRGDGLSQPDP